jgi:microcystin-dependent protein
MAVNLSPIGNGFQFFNNDGLPLNAGKIFTYQAGSTTPLATYTDSSGLIANTNPIILGTDGRPPSTIWLTQGFFYKFVLKDSSDVTIQTYDNIYGIVGATPPAATPIPSGGIFLWSGSIGSIPAGYVLCNGSNGTPDLRNRFVVGAGSTYAVDATGGSADAVVVSHNHALTFTDPGHSHVLNNAGIYNTGVDNILDVGSGSSDPRDGNIFNQATTTVTTGISVSIASAGVSGTNANLPPYYALCYIMKT